MKKIVAIIQSMSLLFAVMFLAANIQVTHAHGDQVGTITEVLEEILSSRNLKTVDQLACEDLTDSEWEELGESVMNQAHPDPQQHEAMDEMMGGEGSETLEQAHINMGKAYLGCASGSYGMMGMMGNTINGTEGTSMMSDRDEPNASFPNMMNGLYQIGFGTSSYGLLGAFLFWLVIFVAIYFAIRWLTTGQFNFGPNKSALDILKERYAKGEIDKKAFEEMKKTLAE